MPTPHQKNTDESIPGSRDAVGFVLRLGRALHVYGIPAHRLEEVMEKAAENLGLQGQFFSTPTAIFASFGQPIQFQQKLLFSPQVCWRFIKLMYRIGREHTKKRSRRASQAGFGIRDSG